MRPEEFQVVLGEHDWTDFMESEDIMIPVQE